MQAVCKIFKKMINFPQALRFTATALQESRGKLDDHEKAQMQQKQWWD